MMITVQDIYRCFDDAFPYCMQESYDNSGVMVDSGQAVTKVVVALDITNAVVDYAASAGADLIVSHHPVIFHPLRHIEAQSPVYRLIAKGISAISVHTNFDIGEGGVNDQLASRLGLQQITPVFKVSECTVHGQRRDNFIGRAGRLPEEMTPAAFAAYVGEKLCGRTAMEYVDGGRPVRRVAVGGGACGEFIIECKANNIDAFVTGEAKHHELIWAADNGLTLIAAGHYATENVAIEALATTLTARFKDLPVFVTRLDNPLQYNN